MSTPGQKSGQGGGGAVGGGGGEGGGRVDDEVDAAVREARHLQLAQFSISQAVW